MAARWWEKLEGRVISFIEFICLNDDYSVITLILGSLMF